MLSRKKGEVVSLQNNRSPDASTFARGQSGSERKDSCASTRTHSSLPSLRKRVGQRRRNRRRQVCKNVREAANFLVFFFYQGQLIIMPQKSVLTLQPTLFSLWLLLFFDTRSHCMTWARLWLGLPCTFWSKRNKLETKACEVLICNSCRTWVAAQQSLWGRWKCLFYFM